MENDEPTITINGQLLSPGEAMTLRVALQVFLMEIRMNGCGNDDHGRKMTANYQARGRDINEKMRARPDIHFPAKKKV